MRRAIAFLTIVGGSRQPTPSTFAWFPVVGAALGLVVGSLWWLASRWWPALLAGALALVADLVLTGLLHVDGLADAGDGLIAPMRREDRLRVMADPAIGAFGAITVVAVLAVRWAAFASGRPAPLVLAGLWCASRTSMVVVGQSVPYARPDGIASAFLGAQRHWIITVAVVIGYLGAAALVVSGGARGVGALGGELLAIGAVVWWSIRRLGGFTGDVLGAGGVIGETVGLVVWALR